MKDSNTYLTLEDYLINAPTIDIEFLMKSLKQVFITLDKLYNLIQFHHCDPKYAQILLGSHRNTTVGDLDKVTFSMLIKNKPYRINLKKRLGIATGENINLVNKITKIEAYETKKQGIEIIKYTYHGVYSINLLLILILQKRIENNKDH